MGLINSIAQSLHQFKYQAVYRNNVGVHQGSLPATVILEIRQNTSSGVVVFTETHSMVTSSTGLLNLSVGSISDLSIVDWPAGPFFLEVDVNGSVLGNQMLQSVPYAFYAKEAATAFSVDYINVLNAPDFSSFDQDVSDDFDGDYNSLSNLPVLFGASYDCLTNSPVTITAEQMAKLDSIYVTNAVDIDQLIADAGVNSSKSTFPRFGTVPGTTLEGGSTIWSKTGMMCITHKAMWASMFLKSRTLWGRHFT